MTFFKNAVIESVSLDCGERAHGCLSLWVNVRYNKCTGQGFGGYNLGGRDNWRIEKNHGGRWILRCMEIAGVDTWGDMPGKTIRVALENDLIVGIGHIVDDEWFYPSIELKEK